MRFVVDFCGVRLFWAPITNLSVYEGLVVLFLYYEDDPGLCHYPVAFLLVTLIGRLLVGVFLLF